MVSAAARRGDVGERCEDRAALNTAFSEVMGALAAKYPDDLHALTLYAESLMDRMPWAYWNDDGTPKEMTPTLVEALEKVLAGDPEHPGAAHLYRLMILQKMNANTNITTMTTAVFVKSNVDVATDSCRVKLHASTNADRPLMRVKTNANDPRRFV